MPNIKDQSTVDEIARIFCDPKLGNRVKTKTLKLAGYSEAYYMGGRSAEVVWENERVLAAIALIDGKTAEKSDITRQGLIDDLSTIAKDGKKDSDRIKAMSLIADMTGYKRELAPNAEKEAAKHAMTDNEKKHADEFAKHRTDEESRDEPKVINIKEIV